MWHAGIKTIEANAFRGLTNLKELILWDNELSSIESGAFSGLMNLPKLNLEENEALAELNLADADFSSLTYF